MVDKIIMLKIEQITPYVGNVKLHPQEQIERIKYSIEKFGFNDPIAIWGEKNIIVEGHGRYEAAKQLDIKEVPCIRLDHLTEDERKAYTLVHNKTTMDTGFDMYRLNEELKNIELDMRNFNFDVDVDVDDYFEEKDEDKNNIKDEKIITCPKCGFEFKEHN